MTALSQRPGPVTGLLAAASVLLPVAATVLIVWYREAWVWENPRQALAGVGLAVSGTAGSVFLAVTARQGRVAPSIALGSAVVALAVVAVGCLLLVRSGAVVVPVFVRPWP